MYIVTCIERILPGYGSIRFTLRWNALYPTKTYRLSVWVPNKHSGLCSDSWPAMSWEPNLLCEKIPASPSLPYAPTAMKWYLASQTADHLRRALVVVVLPA